MTFSVYLEPLTAQVLFAALGLVLALTGLFKMLERKVK